MKTGLKRWGGRVPDLGDVIARFPVAVGIMAIFTIIIIFFDNFGSNEPLGRMLAGLIVGAYLAFCIAIAREAQGQSRLIPVQILAALICAVLAWFSKELRINLPMAIGAVLLILGNMVLWKKSRDNLHIWDFTHKIWTGAVFAIQAALKSLFGLRINDLTEHLILPIGLGFLAPLYWLSTAPKTDESYQELHDNPGFVSKAVAFMGTWLLSPLTLIYALILIAYGFKIVLAGSLPKGEIAQLTTPFLIIGTLTWLLLEPPFIKAKALANLFRKLWFPLSIPAAILLAISIAVRIGEYGFTPERIALLMAVIWSLGLGAWFTFGPKAKRDIRFVPAFAAVLLVIGAFGAELLSAHNQKSRAISGMKAAGIMTDMGVIKRKEDINIMDTLAAGKAKGSLAYLARQDEKALMNRLFNDAENVPEFGKYNTADLYERLRLTDIALDTSRYQTRSINYEAENKIMDIAGYEKLYGPFSYYARSATRKVILFSKDGFLISGEGHDLSFVQNDMVKATFNIQDFIENLAVSDGTYRIKDEVIAALDQDGQKIVIRVTSIGNWKDDANGSDEDNITFGFYILTKGL
jgi:hypothetical protein